MEGADPFILVYNIQNQYNLCFRDPLNPTIGKLVINVSTIKKSHVLWLFSILICFFDNRICVLSQNAI